MDNKIVVLGGDRRMSYVYDYLTGDGLNAYRLLGENEKNEKSEKSEKIEKNDNTEDKPNLSYISDADVLILGMPSTSGDIYVNAPFTDLKIPVLDVLQSFNGTKLLGGVIPPNVFEYAAKRNIECTDYSKIESLMVYNAISTAEGAIYTAGLNTPFTICGSKCLVMGYGRIGKILSHMLKGIGADVTVSARKESDFAHIISNGLKCVESQNLKSALTDKNIIFNTVPHNLINNEYYRFINKNALITDLASKPGYINKELCEKYGIKTIHALALPGKTAPQSAGYAIYKTIKKVI